jgi:uncharacterized protein
VSQDATVKRPVKIIAGTSILLATGSSATRADEQGPRGRGAGTSINEPIFLHTGFVVDAAHVLSPAERSELAAKLEALDHATQRQIAIVTVPSLGGRDVHEFALFLADSWGIERKDYRLSVVLLVAPIDRKASIVVRRNLEAVLPPVVCQEIVDAQMVPHLKRGDLPGGIAAATDALITRLMDPGTSRSSVS